MQTANWLTLFASVIALLSVLLSYYTNKRQLENANRLTIQQIKAAASDTARKLRAEILLKEQQAWVREFRETINEILYLCDPDLDNLPGQSTEDRIRLVTRLAHKVDLLLPVGREHVDLIGAITDLTDFLKQRSASDRERYQLSSQIMILTRRMLREELTKVDSSLSLNERN
jgi:hypothetical protein